MEKTFILGVGFQKCGTSWLFNYLLESAKFHPGFQKEYHIWDAIDIQFLKKYQAPAVEIKNNHVSNSQQLRFLMQKKPLIYFNYFHHLLKDQKSITADITPSYSSLSAERFKFIKENFNNIGIQCKVVVLLREPVSRVKSAVRYNLDRKNYTEGINDGEQDFEKAILQYYKSKHCRIRTEYNITLGNVFNAFNEEDVYVGFYENMFTEKKIFEMSNFLGVEFLPSLAKNRVNKTFGAPEKNYEIEKKIKSFYSSVYEYCFDRFPVTRSIW